MAGPRAPAASGRRGPGSLRLAAGVLAALAATLVAAAAALWWWSGREGSLQAALAWLARTQPELQAGDVRGSLRQGGQVGRLRWQHGPQGLRVEAEQLTVQWRLADLLRAALAGRPAVHLTLLQADRLRLSPGTPAQPGTPPASLALPVELRVDRLQVQRLQWAGSPALEAQGLDGAYRFVSDRHTLELTQARHGQGRYRGRAELHATTRELDAELHGQLQSPVPSSRQVLDVALQLRARGPLEALRLEGRLDGSPAQGTAQASRAQLQALVTPWRSPVLPQASARFERLDLAMLWPQAPRTRLSGQARVTPQGAGWHFDARLDNGAAGPWDHGGLPLDSLHLRGLWQGGALVIEDLQARLGGGQLQARGQATPARTGGRPGWRLQARFDGVQAAGLDSRWPAQVLQGQGRAGQAEGDQALQFDLRLSGPQAPSGDALAAWKLREALARGQWTAGLLQLERLELRTSQARLQGSGQFRPGARTGQGQLQLDAPGLQTVFKGAWPLERSAGSLALQAAEVHQALPWLRSLPMPAGHLPYLNALRAQGRASLRLQWERGLTDADLQARLDLAVLDGLSGTGASLRSLQASAEGPLGRLQWQAQGALALGARTVSGRLRGEAALPPQALRQALASGPQRLDWRMTLAELALTLNEPTLGRWNLANSGPLTLRGAGGRLQAEPGELRLLPPRAGAGPALLRWRTLHWQAGELHTAGELRDLPLSWAELLAGPVLSRAGMVGDLVFDGRWDAQLGQRLRLRAELQRRSGDLSLHAETGQGLAARVTAGVRQAHLSLGAEDEALTLGWRWDSERAGQSEGQVRTRLQHRDGGWRWPAEAPLSGRLQAQLPRLGVWTALAPPGWRLRGAVAADLALGGTRSQPLLNGTLQADDLALRSVVDGIELGRGRLRAQLEGERLRLQELSLRGPGAQGGTLVASGEASWVRGQPRVQLEARLNRLRASVRSDRQLTVSGELQGRLQGLPGRVPAQVTGALRLDQARIQLPEEDRPQLDSDVQVRRPGQPAGPASSAARNGAPGLLDLAVHLDLGEDFQVEGKGLQARLRGALAVTGDAFSRAPRLTGSITTASGQYRAYGQRLEIERGLLRFSGPADNPALDILALRPNLAQPVGVQITGTALLPRVRLYSEPEMPEAEKLAWLVLGRSGASGGAEAAVLQQAAIALLGNRSALGTGGLAASLGLDELSLRGGSTQADGTASGGAIAFGKRLSSNFYAVYESSLSGAVGTLFLFYELSQRLTVRAQTGAQTAVDLIYTLPYD